MGYKPIIGMEIHCQLKTKSKMFCSCKNGLGETVEPNINICPICTAQPGTMPFPNKTAIEKVIKTGIALKCERAEISKFDRKNYFYPDLPKGYQISQYDLPLCKNGQLQFIDNETNGIHQINITRIHIEEDTGKLIHKAQVEGALVDFNRCGIPLMELVTEPDIRTAKQAKMFCQEFQKVLRYIDVSDADMEKAQMRCEVNISLMDDNKEEIMKNFGTKVEIKNINSFKAVEKSIEYEIKRQTELLQKGEKVIQETRGWNDKQQATISQRTKGGAADYRYFPEPDIPIMKINHTDALKPDEHKQNQIYVKSISAHIPELPFDKEQRFTNELGIEKKDSKILTTDHNMAYYTEEVISDLEEWFKSIYKKEKSWDEEKKTIIKIATGWITSKLFKLLTDNNVSVQDTKVTAENFAELISILYTNQVTSSTAQTVLEEMFKTGQDPSQIIEEKGLTQIDDSDVITNIVNTVIKEFPDQVNEYKNGKEPLLQFLVGQVMKASKGQANPQTTSELLKELINNK